MLARGGELRLEHLPEELCTPQASAAGPTERRTLAEVEREHILCVLESCGGSQPKAADVLGIGRVTLWRKLRQCGVIPGAGSGMERLDWHQRPG